MWNKEHVTELLKDSKKIATTANLKKLQDVIDVDKYEASFVLGNDLCGNYADFCANCDKSKNFPCARAYVACYAYQGGKIRIATAKHTKKN